MADANEILALGMDAARDGNREEARNLFTLLTRQDPDNIQAWLWLAGVSDDPRQRRSALERALEIDPQNDMALRGLRALNGVQGGDRRSIVDAVKQTTSNLLGRRGGPIRPSRPLSQYEEELTRELESVEPDLYEDDDEPRGPSPVMWGILGVLVLVLAYFLASQFLGTGEESADSGSLTDGLLSGIIRAGDPDRPRRLVPQLAYLINFSVDLLKQWSHRLHQPLSRFGGGNVAGGTRQQSDPQTRFEVP